MKSYTELPVFFVNDSDSDTNVSEKISEISDKLCGTAAFPERIFNYSNHHDLERDIHDYVSFDRNRLKLPDRFSGKDVFPKEKYAITIVGAGTTGLHVASQMQEAGIDFVVLEKQEFVGGIWAMYANEKSQVNSSEAAYRLVEKDNTNKDHSTKREILQDVLTIAENIGDRLFLNTTVSYVEKINGTYTIRLENGRTIQSGGVIMAINDRVGVPRQVNWNKQEDFSGIIRNGFSDDAQDVKWVGKRVVIVGMGAFATENLRTALEGGASHVTILARRQGTVCPKYIDYINFVNKTNSDSLNHDSITNTKNMITWRSLYERTRAKMPECWMKDIKHYGHTISVSDIWFVGHHLGIIDSLSDEIDYFQENGVVTKNSGFIEADIVIKCAGFERNAQLIPKLSPYTTVNSCNYIDDNFMYLADALIDDNVFNSVFGSSVVEMTKMFCSVYLYFWKNPQDYALVKSKLSVVHVEDRKWSDYIAGLDTIFNSFDGIREIAKTRINERHNDFIKAHDVEEYLSENRREWNELHGILGVWSDVTDYLPYPDW